MFYIIEYILKKRGESEPRSLHQVWVYLCKSGCEDQSDILEYMSKTYDELRGDVMTIAEKLQRDALQQGILKGMEQGIQRGMQQGMQQGMQKQAYAIAEKMVREGADFSFIMRITGLSAAELERIKASFH